MESTQHQDPQRSSVSGTGPAADDNAQDNSSAATDIGTDIQETMPSRPDVPLNSGSAVEAPAKSSDAFYDDPTPSDGDDQSSADMEQSDSGDSGDDGNDGNETGQDPTSQTDDPVTPEDPTLYESPAVASMEHDEEGAEDTTGGTPEVPEPAAPVSKEASEALRHWWAAAAFPGKEYTELADDGMLMLRRANGVRPRPLGALTPERADATIGALTTKFPELDAKVTELRTEWDRTEDKMKLQGRVHKLRDYLSNTIAIGDFQTLMVQLAFWDNHLEGLMAKADEKKTALIQQAEDLAKRTDWKEASAEWRPLVDAWKAAGMAHRETHEALWTRFETAREAFYEAKREANAETEKDLMQNLDLKMEIVEKAEKLAATDTWKKTTEAFTALMEEWKSTGRTVADKQEALWQRFITAKNVFFDRKRGHYDEIQKEQEGSLVLKNAIVEEAEALAGSQEWKKGSDAFDALMERWKKSGRVPEEKGEALWKKFNAARDTFFGARRQHTEQKRVAFADNLAKKSALVSRAEALQNSTLWRETTSEFAELMEEWKSSGPVPKSEGDKLWDAFNGARRRFFDRKDADRDKRNVQFTKFREEKVVQNKRLLQTMEEELKEEEANLAGLHEGLTNLTGAGKKDAEIRAHLESLIPATERSIEKKKEKIARVKSEGNPGERPRRDDDRPRREEGRSREEGRAERPKREGREDRPRRERGDRPDRPQRAGDEIAGEGDSGGRIPAPMSLEAGVPEQPAAATDVTGTAAPAEGTVIFGDVLAQQGAPILEVSEEAAAENRETENRAGETPAAGAAKAKDASEDEEAVEEGRS